MVWIEAYISNLYFYAIYSIIVFISCTIIRDRKLFPARSSGLLLLLSSLPAFFSIYLFIRSLGSGYRYGNGTCGPEGCIYSQPLLFTIDNILFVLVFPLIVLTIILALLMVLSQIRWLKNDRLAFDGASILFAGSMLFVFSIIGGYIALNKLSMVFLAVTLLLLVKVQRYKSILWVISITYLYPIFFW